MAVFISKTYNKNIGNVSESLKLLRHERREGEKVFFIFFKTYRLIK
jgi:hypothetical protein